jgi:ribosome recycling factor
MALEINEAKKKLDSVLEHLGDELKKLRTGRANAAMLDGVRVVVYGQDMQLSHVATITVLDAQMLQVAPFDISNLQAISAAIRDDQSLGLNPSDDGRVVRVPIPPMTQERRLEVVKQMKAKLEEANVAMRNIRHEVLNTAKNQVKEKSISEDEEKRIEKSLNEMLDEFKRTSEEMVKNKETELMTV